MATSDKLNIDRLINSIPLIGSLVTIAGIMAVLSLSIADQNSQLTGVHNAMLMGNGELLLTNDVRAFAQKLYGTTIVTTL
jgi:hypothetical protein